MAPSSRVPADLPKMEYRCLGRSGLAVSCIALGGWLTYAGYNDTEKTFACMKAAYDCGINFFDCAEGYAGGESERIMGDAIRKFGWKRNDLVISTKIYWGAANGDNPVNNTGLSRKHIVEGTNASLERLQLSYVDILYAHRPDRNTPMEEIVRAFNYLIDQGKCFYWGTSDWRSDELERAHHVATRLGLVGPVVEQPQYNMLAREKVEKEFILLYENSGLGLTPYSPLKGGLLTGKYNNGIPDDSRLGRSYERYAQSLKKRLGDDHWDEQIRKTKKLKAVADKLDTTLAALAMAWVLRNPNVASAVLGASHPNQIFECVRSIDVVPRLSDDIMDEIDVVLGNKPAELVRRYA